MSPTDHLSTQANESDTMHRILKAPTPDRPCLAIRRLARASVLAMLTLQLSASADALGQSAPTNRQAAVVQTTAGDSPKGQLLAKLAEAQAAASLLQAESVTNLPPEATRQEVIEYRSAVQMLAKTYQSHLDNLAAIEDIRQRQQDVERMAKAWSGFDQPPPYSILFVDELRDTVQSLEDKIQLGNTALAFVDKLTSNFETSRKEHESELRRLNEQLEESQVPAALARLNWQRELAQVKSRLSAATRASFEAIRQKTNEELSENRMRLAFAKKQLQLAAQQVRFPKADLDRALDALTRERLQLEAEAQTAFAALERSRTALAAAREELQRAQRARPQQAAEPALVRRLQEIVDVRDVQTQTDAEIVSGIRQLLDGNTLDCQLWQLRHAVFNTRVAGELQEAHKRLSKLSDLAVAARHYFSQKATLTASQGLEQQNCLSSASDTQQDKTLIQERVDSLQKRALIYRRVLERVERRERLILRWRESLDWTRENLTFADRMRNLFGETTRFLAALWNFELFVAEDTITVDGQKITGHRGVTVGKVAQALLILIIGYWLSSCVARSLQRLAALRLGVEQNQANLIRRWVLVALMTVLSIISLILVKIPLTIFTFAGGALAIGFGFGMQNLIKNFISGIIILFERPFRVGDVLDINGRCGTVTSIGFRSSIVLFWDGTETLIPNSSLLENNLTNWTFSSRNVRFTIAVGVAYGSDTTLVTRLLAEIADRHGLVRKDPPPQVLFTNFSDSNLCFEVRFWMDVTKHNSAQVASDLRHMIAKTFVEHGINMAFPQRDMHWDAKPLQVQITRAEATGSDAKV